MSARSRPISRLIASHRCVAGRAERAQVAEAAAAPPIVHRHHMVRLVAGQGCERRLSPLPGSRRSLCSARRVRLSANLDESRISTNLGTRVPVDEMQLPADLDELDRSRRSLGYIPANSPSPARTSPRARAPSACRRASRAWREVALERGRAMRSETSRGEQRGAEGSREEPRGAERSRGEPKWSRGAACTSTSSLYSTRALSGNSLEEAVSCEGPGDVTAAASSPSCVAPPAETYAGQRTVHSMSACWTCPGHVVHSMGRAPDMSTRGAPVGRVPDMSSTRWGVPRTCPLEERLQHALEHPRLWDASRTCRGHGHGAPAAPRASAPSRVSSPSANWPARARPMLEHSRGISRHLRPSRAALREFRLVR